MVTPDEVVKFTLSLASNFNVEALPILADMLEEAGMPFDIEEDDIFHLRTNHNGSYMCAVVENILKFNGYQESIVKGIWV